MPNSSSSSRAPFVAAFVTALLGFVLLRVYVQRLRLEVSGGAPVTLLALREDLPAGTRIREEHLTKHDVPESYVESRQVRASEATKVVGVKTAVELEANDTLAWTDLARRAHEGRALSDRVPPGMRAVSVSNSSREGVHVLVRPGDRVDVLITRKSHENQAVTIPLLQNVLVLSVGSRFDSSAAANGERARAVALLVTVDQAALLVHAKNESLIHLVLRNSNDLEVSEGLPDTYDSDIVELDKRALRQRRAALERVR